MPLFDYHATSPEAARVGAEGLTSRSESENGHVVSAYDFSHVGTVVDVGGGKGTLLASILTANPRMKGILFEKPQVIAMAQPFFERSGLSDRCEFIGGTSRHGASGREGLPSQEGYSRLGRSRGTFDPIEVPCSGPL